MAKAPKDQPQSSYATGSFLILSYDKGTIALLVFSCATHPTGFQTASGQQPTRMNNQEHFTYPRNFM